MTGVVVRGVEGGGGAYGRGKEMCSSNVIFDINYNYFYLEVTVVVRNF